MLFPERAGPLLDAHRTLFRGAFAAANIFSWVIIFRILHLATLELDLALMGTVALYALSNLITLLLTPLAGHALRKGVRRSLTIGTMMAALSMGIFTTLFLDTVSRDTAFWLMATFAVTHGMYRAIYWIPYRTTAAINNAKTRFSPFAETIIMLMPALAGYALTTSNNGALILFSSATMTLIFAGLLLHDIPEHYESFNWSYLRTLRELCARSNNTAIGLFILDGIQGATLLILWPLAAFILLNGSYIALGIVLSVILCITHFSRHFFRDTRMRKKINESPRLTATIVFSSWIFRLAASAPIHVVLIDIFYGSSVTPRRFSIDHAAHEQHADSGHYIDEYTAIKEMGLAVGKIVVSLLFVILVLATSESLAFAAALFTAALASAWSVLISNKLQKVL